MYNCKEIWEAAVGEVLMCAREPHNALDRYAVSVNKAGTVIVPSYIPRKLSMLCCVHCLNILSPCQVLCWGFTVLLSRVCSLFFA